MSSSTKGMITSQIQRTIDVMNDYGLIFNDNQIISKTVQVNWSNKQFEEFNKKIENLIGEIDAQGEDTEKQLHYINIVGFEISDKIFNRKDDV